MRGEQILPFLTRCSDLLPRRNRILPRISKGTPPLLIMGSGRNGSTLLGSILNRHPEVFIAPEQFALPYAIIRYKLLNLLDWQDLVKIVVGEFSDPRNSYWKRSFTHLIPQLYELPKEQRSLRTIIDHIYQDLASAKEDKVRMWGDKTPLNTRMSGYVLPVFKDARFLFLLRDGRDVVSSYAKGDPKLLDRHTDPINAARIWSHSLRVWEQIERTVPSNRRMMVRYEDLVSTPPEVLERICGFLDLTFHSNLLETTDQQTMKVEGLSIHRNIGKPVSERSVGRWKQELDQVAKEMVLPLLQNDLERYGYQ
ncbi:MAG: sulfotransferase [Flavobacteriales bacterium]|nr:sulfotransferase [Flavobacteriales bacterium]